MSEEGRKGEERERRIKELHSLTFLEDQFFLS